MGDKQAEVAKALGELLGSENLSEDMIPKLDPLPSFIARPGSADEVAACLKVCSELDAAVVPAGQMTWLDCGNPLKHTDVVLSLERMNRVIDYSPPDLTATVEAGLTLSGFNAVTMPQRQWLPLDPPASATSSLGAIAACNSSGPLRLGFGTPRDYVIGLKLAHADGTQSKSGGRVVKNVAGYDMNKLYVGSYGTLAVISEITFKLRPLPEHAATILVSGNDKNRLMDLAFRVLRSDLQPASAIFFHSFPEAVASQSDGVLFRFIGEEAAVASQISSVMNSVGDQCEARRLGREQAEKSWLYVADLNSGATRLMMSLPLSKLRAELEETVSRSQSAATADLGTGIIRTVFDEDQDLIDDIRRLRKRAIAAGGVLLIEKASPEVKRAVGCWGDEPATAALMRSLKEKFDPQSILNPGRFVAGI